MSKFHPLIVKEIRQETLYAVSIHFSIPENLKEFYKFTPGQYVSIKANIRGKEIRRTYSICSSVLDINSLAIVVKAIPGGVFSKYAINELKEGSVLDVSQPDGKFTLKIQKNAKHYIAFAAGSGITPIMSMILSVLKKEPQSTFTLVYGNKSSKDTIFYKELNELVKESKGALRVHYVFSRSNEKKALLGRISKNLVDQILRINYSNISFDAFYICGPKVMIDQVIEELENCSVDKESIYFELFIDSSSEELQNNTNGDTSITVILDHEKSNLSSPKKTTLLRALIEEGLEPPYSCEGGICSSCVARVIRGEVIMEKNSILTDSEIQNGLILTCQAHATTDQITIDFDDV